MTVSSFPFVTTKPLGTLAQGVELHRLLLGGKDSGLEGIQLPKGEWRVRKVGNTKLTKAKAQINGETVWGYVAVKAMLAKAHDCIVSLGTQAKAVGAIKNDGVGPDGAIVKPSTAPPAESQDASPTPSPLYDVWTEAEKAAVSKAEDARRKAIAAVDAAIRKADKAAEKRMAACAKQDAPAPAAPANGNPLAALSPEQIAALPESVIAKLMGV